MARFSPQGGDADSKPAKAPVGSLRALWPYVMRQRGLFVAWLLALACSSGATLTLPVAFRQMIDHGFSSGTNIDRTFSLVFAVVVVLALATAARFFFVSLLGERVVADLRNRLYAQLIGLMPNSTTAPAAASWSLASPPTPNCCAAWWAPACRWRYAAASPWSARW